VRTARVAELEVAVNGAYPKAVGSGQ
jgi:hypothetical protein